MSWGENQRIYGLIVFQSESEDELAGVPRFVSSELIRFGRSSPVFHSSPKSNTLFTLEYEGLYLKDGSPWGHPYKKLLYQYPNISIRVHYRGDNQSEWESVAFGEEEDKRGQLAQLEEYLANEFNLPLKKTSTEQPTIEEEPEPSSVNFENQTDPEIDPAQERRENTEKIKDLITDGQETLALQLVRSLNDPEIYEALLRDCCEISDNDEDEGWIQVSELFKEHDALFFQLLAIAPDEANLPGPLRAEFIESIHLSNSSLLSNLDFLRDYPRLKSFSIWGWGEDVADLNDISGLEGLTRLKSLQLNGLKSSPDWTPLQHLVQLRELTLSGEKLEHPGSLVFRRLTKLKELSITCNGAVEMQGLSACIHLNSLTLNEAKSLGSLSFLESLQSLRCLRIGGYGGDSLEGIGKCRKITEFSISNAGKLEDISELSSLSRLRELTLSGKFQDLDPLKSLASLQSLYINDAKELRDVSGLSGCLGLERINMYGVSSLGSLWGIGQLECLLEFSISSWGNTMGYMDIHEVRELCNLRDLTISCSGRILRGFPAVRHLKKLRSLDLSGCNCLEVMDLSPLRESYMLGRLQMSNCPNVTNLDGLSNLEQLETLELTTFPDLASLSGLRDSDYLQQLTITGCREIEGLDDLANLNGLTHLALRYFDKLRDASSIYGMTQLETLDLEGAGRLSDISFLDSLEDLNSLDLSCCYRIHPDDFIHLYEDDFETLYLPDTDEYEDDECEEDEDEEEENPWGERNLDDIPDDEWLRLYNKEQGYGLLQKAVAEGWLDRVPEHIGTRENLLAVGALHFAAQNRNFGQIPDLLLTVENLLAEDADHHWNVFHFAAGYGSLDLLPDHLLVEKNLQVPTRVDCPFFDNIFAGSTCLHIAAARGALTLLPRFLLTPQNLLLKDDRGNTSLDQAEIQLQTLQDKIDELKEKKAEQGELAVNEDWLKTVKIQIAHLKQQLSEMPEETETGEAETGEAETGEAETGEAETGEAETGVIAIATSNPADQVDAVIQNQHTEQAVGLYDDIMLDGGEERASRMLDKLEVEPVQTSSATVVALGHPEKQLDAKRDQQGDRAVGIIDEMVNKNETTAKREESPQKMSVKELSLNVQPSMQQEEPLLKISLAELSLDEQSTMQQEETEGAEELVAEEPVAAELVAQDPVAEKVIPGRQTRSVGSVESTTESPSISPLAMNTWFHCIEEAKAHRNVVVKLDIIHQESVEELNILAEFQNLEELHFIKVNIGDFQCLTSVPKLCHIKFESCEVSGWAGLLDVKGLKKIGCFPEYPPDSVKQLLEGEGVDVYLFAPIRIDKMEPTETLQAEPEIVAGHEVAFAK